jgi:hypothetical protein
MGLVVAGVGGKLAMLHWRLGPQEPIWRGSMPIVGWSAHRTGRFRRDLTSPDELAQDLTKAGFQRLSHEMPSRGPHAPDEGGS